MCLSVVSLPHTAPRGWPPWKPRPLRDPQGWCRGGVNGGAKKSISGARWACQRGVNDRSPLKTKDSIVLTDFVSSPSHGTGPGIGSLFPGCPTGLGICSMPVGAPSVGHMDGLHLWAVVEEQGHSKVHLCRQPLATCTDCLWDLPQLLSLGPHTYHHPQQ